MTIKTIAAKTVSHENLSENQRETPLGSPEVQGASRHFGDPVSGWRSDDAYSAIHDELAAATFTRLYDALEVDTQVITSASDAAHKP